MVKTIIVVENLHPNTTQDEIEEVLQRARNAEPEFMKDEGTVSVKCMVDDKNPRKIIFVEVYEDEDAFQLHMKNPFRETFKQVEKYVEKMEVLYCTNI